MARPELKTVLENARQVVRFMREEGIDAWPDSPVGHLALGAPPPSRQKKPDVDPKQARRAYYEEVLGRPVGDSELEKLP